MFSFQLSLVILGVLLLIQQRNRLQVRILRHRSQEGRDIGQILVRDGFAGIRRHRTARFPNILDEIFTRARAGRDGGRGPSRAAIRPVTRPAEVRDVEFLSIFGIAGSCRGSRRGCLSDRQRVRNHHRNRYDKDSPIKHVSLHSVLLCYLGWVRTSTIAGSPRFTTSTARFSAGPNWFGSLIGPSPCMPILSAIFA